MKKKSFIPGLTFFCFLIISCQKKPDAAFESSKTVAETNELLTFKNKSLNAESYEWDFGDGTKSYDDCPSKYYEKAGIYRVKLTGISKKGKKYDVSESEIRIYNVNEKFAGDYEGEICSVQGEFKISKGNTTDDLHIDINGVKLIALVDGNSFFISRQQSSLTMDFFFGYGTLLNSDLNISLSRERGDKTLPVCEITAIKK